MRFDYIDIVRGLIDTIEECEHGHMEQCVDLLAECVMSKHSIYTFGASHAGILSEEMYYRLFAFSILPESVDKVLYLDPDIIVRKSLKELYDLDTGTAYVAGCTHVRELLTKINSMRLKTDESKAYLNTGVLLMNLALLRKDFTKEEIVHTIMENRPRLLLPDQDVLVILFRDRIMTIDSFRYNLSDRIYSLCRLEDRNINIESVKKNTAIIHYCGRNKPWREGYHGELGQFFNEYEREAKSFFDGTFSCC